MYHNLKIVEGIMINNTTKNAGSVIMLQLNTVVNFGSDFRAL